MRSHLWAYFIPLCVAIGLKGGGAWHFTAVIAAFGLLPLLDHWVGVDRSNPTADDEERLRADKGFSFALLGYVPVQVALVLVGAWTAAHVPLTGWERLGLILSTGVATGGIGITVSHELCHRPRSLERMASFTLLACVGYCHFCIEHVVGHHHRVATPEDPTSARLGESLYRFLPRTIIGSAVNVWRFEAERLRKRGIHLWSWRNRILWCWSAPGFIVGAIFVAVGPLGAWFFCAQSVVAIVLLESINYVEHYGLVRARLPNGRYEKVSPLHSWNADHLVSNLFLFKLQRHSDHHANPLRPYQILRHFAESPQLPYGYPTMVLLAMVPPLWRRTMGPLVATHRAATS